MDTHAGMIVALVVVGLYTGLMGWWTWLMRDRCRHTGGLFRWGDRWYCERCSKVVWQPTSGGNNNGREGMDR